MVFTWGKHFFSFWKNREEKDLMLDDLAIAPIVSRQEDLGFDNKKERESHTKNSKKLKKNCISLT